LVIEDSSFESCNPVKVALGGAATASVRRNTFHSNMRQPLGQSPDSYQSDGASYAAVHFEGPSTGQKVFAGNNVGAGWVEIVRAKQWVVGGDNDADSNVLVGPRVGLSASESSDVVFRRNYSHHVYVGGWSQGANFELFGTTTSVFEHNVVNDSSWPVRGGGTGSEFRYNLVLMAGHEWMQPAAGLKVHHNIFVGGDQDQGGIYVYNSQASPSAPAISFYNNTLDGLGKDGIMASVRTGSTAGPVTLSSNAFLNYPKGQVILIEGGTVSADYNGFFACQATSYSDGRAGAHDVVAVKAALRSPPSVAFSMDEGAIWTRATTVATVLQAYRSNYEPTAASPLLGAGDPQIAPSNWMGAIGNGTSDLDRFGRP
jgi:hypothetical protein